MKKSEKIKYAKKTCALSFFGYFERAQKILKILSKNK